MSAGPSSVNRHEATWEPEAVAVQPDLARFLILALCFLLSGLAALVYQTAWTRQFALVFGTSEPAVATVLAAYMAGLALGARLVEWALPRIRRPVLAYALLELGIAGGALVIVPAVLLGSDALLQMLFGGRPAPPGSDQAATWVFYLLAAFVALAVPTTLMGATLPLLARHSVRSREQIGRRIGALYAVNTAGAVAGALLTAFWLLPELGLTRTIRAGAAVNGLVFLLAALLVRRSGEPAAGPAAATAPDHTVQHTTPRYFALTVPPAPAWVLPIMLVSGAVSFFHEVLWTRMLSHVLGSSLQAFGVMVGSFLAGIALGGAVGGLLAGTRRRAAIGLAISQLGCAVSAGVAYTLLETVLPERAGLAGNAFLGATLLAPLTIFIGMSFPFAVRVLCEHAGQAAAASARVYAWNTVGAIAGALAAGFVVIPHLRFEGAMQLAVAVSTVLCVACAWLLIRPQRVIAVMALGCAVAAVVLLRIDEPRRLLLASPLNVPGHGRLLFHDVGRSASVVVLEQDGGLVLRTNGLPEASMELSGSAPRFSGEYWLSPLAVIARPETRSMLIVGYGGGMAIEGVPPSVDEIDVIEIEPKVVEANRAVRKLRRYDPLDDPRVRVIVNDARGALNLTSRQYDAIVSQPSHPWTAGSAHLYTREFMLQARSHLSEGGVFVQWMNVRFLDEGLLRSLTATLLDIFEELRIYRPDPSTLVFLASDEPLEPELRVAQDGSPITRSPEHYGRFGIHTVEDLIAALAVDGAGARRLAQGGSPITDDRNRMAVTSVYEQGRALTAEAASDLLAPYDPLRQAESWIFTRLGEQLAFDYIARRLASFTPMDASVPDRIGALVQALGTTPAGHAVRAVELAARGQTQTAQQLLSDAVRAFPSNQALRFEYIRPWLDELARDAAPEHIAAAAEELHGSAALVLQAVRLAAHRRWNEVAELDSRLAEVSWTAPWKPDAVLARADWRTRVGGEDRRRRAEEALRIVDEAIVVQPTLAMYGMRIRTALAAGRHDALLQAIRVYGSGTFNESLRAGETGRHTAAETLRTLIGLLDSELASGPVNPERVSEVRAGLEDRLRRLAGPS